MKWYVPDEKFLDYLRNTESRIPNTYYGHDKIKPFFGKLFEIGDLAYITQVSHPKDRHRKMKNSKDFIKLFDKTRLIGVVNLNYMFPIPKSKLTELKYENISDYVEFSSEESRSKYIYLLKLELKAIKNHNISEKAKYLYRLKSDYPDAVISKRCFDYKMLEKVAKEYK